MKTVYLFFLALLCLPLYTSAETVKILSDDCSTATDINSLFGAAIGTPMLSTIFNNDNATIDPNEPMTGWQCFGEPDGGGAVPSIDNPLWFTFTGDGNKYQITTNDCNGTVTDYIDFGDTQIAIYSGADCSSLTPAACNEDILGTDPNGPYPAGLDFQTENGTVYHMMIDGFNGSDGEFCIEVTQLPDIGCDQIAVGTAVITNEILCWEGSTMVSMTGTTVIPQLGSFDIFAWTITTMDITGSTDPFDMAIGTFGLESNVVELTFTNNTMLGLPPGVYFLTPVVGGGGVDTDGTIAGLDYSGGCILAGNSIQITLLNDDVIPALTGTISSTADTGPNDGTATVSDVAGGTGSYTYLWSNGETTASITGLDAGTYSVTVQDITGCTDPLILIVEVEGTPDIGCDQIAVGTAVITNEILCWEGSTMASMTGTTVIPQLGSFDIFAWTITTMDITGSTDPFDMAIGTFGLESNVVELTFTNNTMLGLPPGVYFLTPVVGGGGVDTDGTIAGLDYSGGCILAGNSIQITLLNDDELLELTGTISSTADSGAGDGTATVADVAGGTGSYTYTWSNGGTMAMISDLAAGTYSVTIEDISGCVDPLILEVDVDGMTIGCDDIAVGMTSITDNELCVGDIAILSVGDGTVIPTVGPDNFFVWILSDVDLSGSTDPFGETLEASDFQTDDAEIEIENDGTLDPGVVYLSPLVIGGAVDSDGTLEGLDLTNGCALVGNSIAVTIYEAFDDLTGTISSTNQTEDPANGTATLDAVNGGDGNYSYLWSNGSTEASITGLAAGDYSVTITDVTGCVDPLVLEVTIDNTVSTTDLQFAQSIQLLPNPATEKTSVQYAFEAPVDLQLSLFNTLGQMMFYQEVDRVQAGTIEVDLQGMTPGVYLVQITDGDRQATQRLVVK